MSSESEERFKRIESSLERTGKAIERTKIIMEGEQIYFTRKKPGAFTRNMIIYLDTLSDKQKHELDRIEKFLFEIADEVTEEGTRTLKFKGKAEQP